MAEKLFLLDGMAMAYRAYFAFISNPLKNSKGENTSAVYGFTTALLKIINDEKPDYIASVFDTPEPTFRHKEYKPYKATREKMPEDMIPQLVYLKSISEAMNVPVIEKPGFEADDIIGTLAVRAAAQSILTYMVTGDKDFMQLIQPLILMYNPMKRGSDQEIIDESGVLRRYNVSPSQITDILGLMGDASDNIPGVTGIGEKTAIKLIQEHGSIENIYKNINTIKGKVKQNLITDKDNALLSKHLATIHLDVPLELDFVSLRKREPDTKKLLPILSALEFNALVKKFSGESLQSDIFDENTNNSALKNIQNSRHDYHTVTTTETLAELCKQITRAGACSFDTETTSVDAMVAELVGVSICIQAYAAYYIPVNQALSIDKVLSYLKPILENPEISKTGQNIKYDYLVMKNCGITMHGIAFDTMIAGHLLRPDRNVNIDQLAADYLHYGKIATQELIGSGKNQTSMADVPLPAITDYACEDADVAYQLTDIFKNDLSKHDLDRAFYDIEIPLLPVLAEMEHFGVWLDLSYLKDMSHEFNEQMKIIEQSIYQDAGTHFNLNSPQQLGEILFDTLQINKMAGEIKVRRTGKTKQYSTDVKNLEKYRGLPIIDALLNYRQLTKLKSTYIDGLPPLVNLRTKRIHSTFSQTITSTGRLSSSNPNFQNIPIRTDLGKGIRKAFRSPLPGWSILSADYSQIELRVMAHLSGDHSLIDAFKADQDIHLATACKVFHLEHDQVTSAIRRKAKDINFGIIYGISAYGLVERIHITNAEAVQLIESYFETYPGVKNYIDHTIEKTRTNGYITTLFGRRRYLPDIQSKNRTVRQFAERAAVNTPIQGTAAELIKLAMIQVHCALQKEKLKTRMILQVHDELVFEIPDHELPVVKSIIKDRMENVLSLKVPLTIDMGIGDNWLETK
jgi:DNA polymerase I